MNNISPVLAVYGVLSITQLVALSVSPAKVANTVSTGYSQVNTNSLSSAQKVKKVVERMETFQPEIRAKEALVIHNQKVILLKVGE